MPYSVQYQQQFVELMEDELNSVIFDKIEDFEIYCKLLTCIVENQAIIFSDHTKKFQEKIEEILDLIEIGFDLYAGEDIIDKINYIQVGTLSTAPRIPIHAFTSAKEDLKESEKKEKDLATPFRSESEREALILEAEDEFKKIMLEGVKLKIAELAGKSVAQKETSIAEQNQKQKKIQAEQKMMSEFKGPMPGTEGHVLSEAQWLAQQQTAFQLEQQEGSINMLLLPNLGYGSGQRNN